MGVSSAPIDGCSAIRCLFLEWLRGRRKESRVPASRFLLLRSLPSVGYKAANGHRLSSNHLVTRVRFSFPRSVQIWPLLARQLERGLQVQQARGPYSFETQVQPKRPSQVQVRLRLCIVGQGHALHQQLVVGVENSHAEHQYKTEVDYLLTKLD